jgi:hypothetical protein
MKSPLSERPILHHLQHRVETHIFLCVLAYHLLIAIEKSFLDQGIHTLLGDVARATEPPSSRHRSLATTDGSLLKIRRATTPNPQQRLIYRVLAIPEEVMPPIKTWLPAQEGNPQG